VSEKSITRQQTVRFRRAKNEPSAPRSLAGGCCGQRFLESRDEGELGYASLESKSQILVKVKAGRRQGVRKNFRRMVVASLPGIAGLVGAAGLRRRQRDGHSSDGDRNHRRGRAGFGHSCFCGADRHQVQPKTMGAHGGDVVHFIDPDGLVSDFCCGSIEER